jgi:hypothetical protein
LTKSCAHTLFTQSPSVSFAKKGLSIRDLQDRFYILVRRLDVAYDNDGMPAEPERVKKSLVLTSHDKENVASMQSRHAEPTDDSFVPFFASRDPAKEEKVGGTHNLKRVHYTDVEVLSSSSNDSQSEYGTKVIDLTQSSGKRRRM